MYTASDLKVLIENAIFESLAMQYLEADIRIKLQECTVSKECYEYFKEAFSVLTLEDTWITLHKIARASNITDDRAFEDFVDRMLEVIDRDNKYPGILKEINVFHIRSLTLSKCLEKISSIQIPNVGDVVTDERWYKEFDKKMDSALSILESSIANTHQDYYAEAKANVITRFPKLKGDALRFFISAEVFYAAFHEEKQVDYAPVMLEYCRAIELTLWAYINNSDIYRAAGIKAAEFNHGHQTFGGAVHTIKTVTNGPLYSYYGEYQKLNAIRNDSAHIFVTRKPNVSEARKKIWETDLLDILL